VPRQIANAHTVFNIANTLIFIGFTGYLARLVERLVPEAVEEEKVIIRPKYLDDALIETPALALQRVRLEIARMGDIIQQMLAELRAGWLERDRGKLEEVQMMDDQVDVLESEILHYLAEVRKQELTEKESAELALAMIVADGFESVGDVIETDLVGLGYRALDEELQISEPMLVLMKQLGDKLTSALDSTIRAVREEDERAADEVLTIKADIDSLIGKALELQSQALVEIDPEKIALMRMEMTVLENLKRIHTLLKRIVRQIVPEAVRASA
jgi:phosphate:Na+ symporter